MVADVKFVEADCKLPLAPTRVLSITSRANAKSLHAVWPIRAPTFHLRQSERHIPDGPTRTRELSSCLSGQRLILTHIGGSRLHTHTSRINTLMAVSFQYKFSSPLLVVGQRAILSLGLTTIQFKFTVKLLKIS